MNEGIPTGKTYFGFVLLWIAVLFVVAIVCIALFSAGQGFFGAALIVATMALLVRHSMSIGRRARRSARRSRPQPGSGATTD